MVMGIIQSVSWSFQAVHATTGASLALAPTPSSGRPRKVGRTPGTGIYTTATTAWVGTAATGVKGSRFAACRIRAGALKG